MGDDRKPFRADDAGNSGSVNPGPLVVVIPDGRKRWVNQHSWRDDIQVDRIAGVMRLNLQKEARTNEPAYTLQFRTTED
jgi:hypothetical protein